MKKILIIEDEPAILLALKDELTADYTVLYASSGLPGIDLALREQPDLILLDIILPDTNGFQVCERLKTEGIDSSIIMLTALGQTTDKVKGLEIGADDYVTKPFSLEELKARIKAALRKKELAPAEIYKDKNLEIDFIRFKARKKKKPLKLSYLEFKLLRFLISQKDRIISRKELLEQVWGYHTAPSTRTVDNYIVSLRKKIGKNYLATFHGEGYRFNPDLMPDDLGKL